MPDDPSEQRYNAPSNLLLSERTAIRLQLGFIGAIIAGIVSAVLFLASIRTDVITMITRVSVQETIISDLQHQLVDYKIHMQSVDDNLLYLRQAIEEDQRLLLNHLIHRLTSISYFK